MTDWSFLNFPVDPWLKNLTNLSQIALRKFFMSFSEYANSVPSTNKFITECSLKWNQTRYFSKGEHTTLTTTNATTDQVIEVTNLPF